MNEKSTKRYRTSLFYASMRRVELNCHFSKQFETQHGSVVFQMSLYQATLSYQCGIIY